VQNVGKSDVVSGLEGIQTWLLLRAAENKLVLQLEGFQIYCLGAFALGSSSDSVAASVVLPSKGRIMQHVGIFRCSFRTVAGWREFRFSGCSAQRRRNVLQLEFGRIQDLLAGNSRAWSLFRLSGRRD